MERVSKVGAVQSHRYHHLDMLKCLGIWFVVIYHSVTSDYNWMNTPDAVHYLRYYLQTVVSTCVPLFFFVNGYLLLNRPLDLKKHIAKSLLLMALTVMWGIIGLLAMMPIEKQHVSFGDLLISLSRFEPIGWINHLWFMGTLIGVYVQFPLLKYAYDTEKRLFHYFVAAASVFTFGYVFAAYAAAIAGHDMGMQSISACAELMNQFSPFRGIKGYAFVYFCIGGMMPEWEESILRFRHRKLIAALGLLLSCASLFALGICFSGMYGSLWDVVWNGYSTVCTLVSVLCLYALCLGYSGKSRMIGMISRSTLGIYFMHMILIRLTREYAVSIPFFRTYMGNAVYALMLIMACLAIVQGIRRIPILRVLVKG